jgi:anaerobic dimethyl sulfoxide reductase subunit A
MGNVPWLRESFENNLLMNPVDAGLRGIKEQDTVRVYNDHGALLRRVHVTERGMAGGIMLAQGAWVDIDEDGNCRGGAANILTGDYASGPNIESWQACIAEVEKHHRSLDEDYMWPQRVGGV